MKALKIFTLLILSIAVVSAAEITLEANKTAMPKGDVVQVDVYVNGTNVGSVLLNLTYEPTKLSLIDRVRYGVFEEEQFKTGANYVAFIGVGGSVSGKTKIATLSFKAVGVATTTNVTPVSSAVNGAPVTVLPEKVTITILDYEVINSTWRDPFAVSIAGMTSFASLDVDDPSDGINWTKVDLPADCKNGVGNNTFIMVRKGSENKVLIYLEGGGACSSYASCGGPASTVTTLEPEFDTGTRPLNSTYVKGIFDVKNPLNPFRNWTMVFVPYSTGDIHMGNRVVKYYNTTNPLQNKTIYHIGYVNAIVAMRWINASGNFDQIVVTGTSAGGFGTILHFYRASEIFGKGIIAINDAGPGTAPNVTSALPPTATAERWGSMQNYPPQSLPYFADTDTIRFLNWALNGSAGGCGNCIYALFEDQWDFIIGPYFQGYSFTDFQTRLLNAIASIKANFSDRFCSYLPLSTYHTAFAGGYNYPAGDRFYNLHIDGYTLVQWINSVLSGNCVDKRDLGLRDLQVEILSAPSSAIVGNAYNITVKVSNVGSNATPDPFFVILSNATATLGYKVMTLPANSNVTFNFTWIPARAGTERLNVTVDGLVVPALATLLPLGSVVELNGYPASEANNTASVTVIVSAPTTPATPRPILGGGTGGGGAMPGVPVYITAYITVKANEESIIDLPQSAFWETNVVALLILSSEDNNIRFRIEKLKELPPGIPEPKGDLVVLILSIEPTLSKEASIKGKIKFGIPIEDIKAKGFDPNLVAVILLKWNGKEWIELPTNFVGSDGKYNYYEAETTSFSYFVAQLKPLETPKPTTPVATPPPTTVVTTPPPTTTPAPGFIPGFEALFAIAGLLAVAYLLRRKN
ncbi:MAG: pectin acetylesterase-family hydrolase [Archaeoglobales archaeon]|nr:pectin acetylesterase-family hydrolase [Archaeoglobales archaeon]